MPAPTPATPDELARFIAALPARNPLPPRPCTFCASEIPAPRPDQRFCSPRCRAAYANAASRLAYEKLLREREEWRAEREELLRERGELMRACGRGL